MTNDVSYTTHTASNIHDHSGHFLITFKSQTHLLASMIANMIAADVNSKKNTLEHQ